MAPAAASSVEASARLVGSLGFAPRRSRRCLQAGPRKDLIVESIAVALSLLAEIVDTKPEFVEQGGMEKLRRLACPAPVLDLQLAPLQKSETIEYVDAPIGDGNVAAFVVPK